MGIKVRVPAPLQKLTGSAEVQADGTTVAEVIAGMEKAFPGVKDKLCDPATGKVRRYLNVFVNQQDARFLQGEATPVKDGDEISIVPAIAGGAR
ncbi:MAG: MoaD/ThiS family protein [Candidatus Brocadiae bacterium]|nr:MoaD/ThiS family protein [Candidatus Brocadiia bacterium]